MKITALEEYGLRCLLQVAREPEGSLLTVSEIAQREALSSEYVAKIMSLLRRGELVESIRGVSGGYRLAKPAREISISALSSAVSNPLYVDGFCTGHRGLATECVHKDDCGIRFLWQEISGKIHETMEKISLEDILERQAEGCLGLTEDRQAAVAQ